MRKFRPIRTKLNFNERFGVKIKMADRKVEIVERKPKRARRTVPNPIFDVPKCLELSDFWI